jgi:hypothetical protein
VIDFQNQSILAVHVGGFCDVLEPDYPTEFEDCTSLYNYDRYVDDITVITTAERNFNVAFPFWHPSFTSWILHEALGIMLNENLIKNHFWFHMKLEVTDLLNLMDLDSIA